MKYDLDAHELLCLTAQALVTEEKAQYQWWVNSQQDPKKFRWVEDGNAFDKLFALAMAMSEKGVGGLIKGSASEYINATGAKFIYMDANKKFYDSDKNPIANFNPREQKSVVVLRLEEHGS